MRLENNQPQASNLKPLLLARFRVFGVRAATRAKLLETQTLFDVFLVLRRLIVALFAIGASQRQIGLILIRHDKSSLRTAQPEKPSTGIEPVTSILPRSRSTTELQGPDRIENLE